MSVTPTTELTAVELEGDPAEAVNLWYACCCFKVTVLAKIVGTAYPTKPACAVTHTRLKVSTTNINRNNRPRNGPNCKLQENPSERKSASLAKPNDDV